MNRPHIKRIVSTLTLSAFFAAFLWSCDKSDSSPGPGGGNNTPGFTPADFEVYNITKEIDADPHEVNVTYYVKNKSDKPYRTAEADDFAVSWKVKGSDGAWYSAKEGISDLNAGASAYEALTVGVPQGFTPDINTLTYEIIID